MECLDSKLDWRQNGAKAKSVLSRGFQAAQECHNFPIGLYSLPKAASSTLGSPSTVETGVRLARDFHFVLALECGLNETGIGRTAIQRKL